MLLTIIGLVILTLIDLLGIVAGELPWLMVGMLVFTGLGWLGVGLAAAGQKKTGAYLIIVAGAVHVPIGLIAAFGGKKMLDEAKRHQFEASRW